VDLDWAFTCLHQVSENTHRSGKVWSRLAEVSKYGLALSIKWMSFDECLSCCTMETREAVMPAMLMITCSAENGLHDKAGKGQSKHQ